MEGAAVCTEGVEGALPLEPEELCRSFCQLHRSEPVGNLFTFWGIIFLLCKMKLLQQPFLGCCDEHPRYHARALQASSLCSGEGTSALGPALWHLVSKHSYRQENLAVFELNAVQGFL